MIRKHLTPHIHKITIHPGYALFIDLFFKHDFKFRIISTYLPSNDSTTGLQTQNLIIQWIKQATSSNLLPIVLGDFNATPDSALSSSNKFKLL